MFDFTSLLTSGYVTMYEADALPCTRRMRYLGTIRFSDPDL